MYNSDIIYIGGIAVIPDKDEILPSKIYSDRLLYALYLYIKTFYSFEKTTTISATAATDQGEHWLRDKLGFKLYKDGRHRKDGHNYYVKEVTVEDIKIWGEKYFEKFNHKIDCSAYKKFVNSEDGKRIFKQI